MIETIHQIGARAERKVERELLEDLKRVSGKQNLLFNLADATLAQPDGVVRDVVFPVVGEQTLRDLVKEWKATGPTYRITPAHRDPQFYQGHYRRMVLTLLAALEFRRNNDRHRRGWTRSTPGNALPTPRRIPSLADMGAARWRGTWPVARSRHERERDAAGNGIGSTASLMKSPYWKPLRERLRW